MEFLKFPLYRLIFNLPLGFSVFFVICIIIGCDEIEKCMKICIDIKLDSSLGVVIYTSVLIVVGEFLAMAGESVTGLFFDFNPIVNKELMEKISPINNESDENSKGKNYIKYKEFVKVLGEATGEASEIHFLWSRTFGGFGILFLFSSIALISVQFPRYQYALCIFFVFYAILLVFAIIAFTSYLDNPSIFKLSYNFNLIICIILPVFLFFIIISIYIIASSQSKLFVTLSLVLLLLSILSFLWSVKYRTFSNRINKFINESIINNEKSTKLNKDKEENVNNNNSDN